MQITRDAALQAELEEQRALNPRESENNEDISSLSDKERLLKHFSENLHDNLKSDGNEESLDVLYLILLEDDDLNDGVYKGQHGQYEMGDGYLASSKLFEKGTANDSPENINGALEMAALSKARFGNEGIHTIHPQDAEEEQIAMMHYANELAGLNDLSKPDNIELSPEIKQEMDAAWDKMQQNLGLKPQQESTLTADANAESQLDQNQTADPTTTPGMSPNG